MRNKFLLFTIALLLVSVFFVSCSDDEDPKCSIVGVWHHYTIGWVWEFKSNKTYSKYIAYEYQNGEEPSYKGTYTFDGKFLVLDGGFKKEVTFSEDGDQISFDGNAYYRVK